MGGPLTGRITPGMRPLSEQLSSPNYVMPPPLAPPFDAGWTEQAPAPSTAAPRSDKDLGLSSAAQGYVTRALADTPESEERNALLLEWTELNQRIREFLTSQREQLLASLHEELAEVRRQGRAALERSRALQREERQARAQVNDHLDALSKAHVALKQAENERPHAEDWPTENELAQHSSRVAGAQQRSVAAEHRHAALEQALEIAQARARGAEKEVRELGQRREALQARIAGQPVPGPFGLLVP